MAIYSSVPPPSQQPVVTSATTSNNVVDAWAASALQALSISSTAISTGGVTLSIPLDNIRDGDGSDHTKATLRRKVLLRDSQKRREALLKGKEGSRRRQRWENDRLLHVPNVQPPLPSDWEVRPTYPVHTVPYYLAPLWEAGVRRRAEELAATKKARIAKKAGLSINGEEKGRIPQELRHKLKKSKGAKTLLQDLEEEIRRFVREWEKKNEKLGNRTENTALDSEDEEIVFVGRDGTMSDEQRKTLEEELEREKLVFDSLVDDHSAGFGRWLVHSIAAYYGLTSRSVTVGPRREAYVGIKEMKTGRQPSGVHTELPRPLWGMI